MRHLQDSQAVRLAKIEERLMLHHPAEAAMHEVVRTFGPNQGLLTGRQLSIGAVRGLTILVNFKDVTSTTTRADVDDMLNGAGFTRNGNVCSVREYFRRVSNGKLDYTNTVVGPYTLTRPRSHYINSLLVAEALQLAVNDGVDLAQFDSQGENIIDALNILYAGQSVYQGDLWPHNSFIDLRFGQMTTNLYVLTGLGRNPAELSIGTFCHENGHLLCRFPDMYDYGSRDGDNLKSAGIGMYCLMGSGNHLDNGRSPSPVCAYLRDLAGWADNAVDLNTAGSYEAKHGDYGTVMKFRASKGNEYFLVENRTRTGLDRALPASGLALYHCDIFGSNEHQEGTADRHYQCALLQADGRLDLERNPQNTGDSTDLYGPAAGVAVSSTSLPHTREWDGRESGLVVADISEPGEVVTFRVGQAVASQTVKGSQSPNLDIPENNPGGVSSAIRIAGSGVVRRIRVDVEITHTYIGDLLVELLSPTGRRAVLHAREGGGQNGLTLSRDSNQPGQLSNLVGQPMQGDWILRVSDRAAEDVGTLRKWGVEIESASS